MTSQDAAPARPILLVDDDHVVLDVTAEILRSDGFEVVAVDRAAEAIKLLEAGLMPSLLVTDHVMPELTGAELLHRVGAVWPDLTIVLDLDPAMLDRIEELSAQFIERVTALPADVPILRKPFRLQDLVGRVRALVHAA